MVTKTSESGNVNYIFKINSGPPVSDKCPECQSNMHVSSQLLIFRTKANFAPMLKVAGPMWSGPLHNTDFVGKVIKHVEENEDHYGTSPRMKGMLTVAKEVSSLTNALPSITD
jgi:tRNA (guanine26-N2/guanine27-N2)-dimethyltransferase